MDLFEAYKITILIAGLTGLMLLIQILVADILAIKKKHTPGYPVASDHDDILFRAIRVHSNTNESIGIFSLCVLFGVLSGASVFYLNVFSSIYFLSRVGHMFFYYCDLRLARSISFALSLVGLAGMLITGLVPWL